MWFGKDYLRQPTITNAIQCLVRLRYLVQNGPMHVKLDLRPKRPPVVWCGNLERRMSAQVSFLSTGLWLRVLHRKPSCLAE
ncbi:hypothetical protein TNCV_3929421 [Trichonephila clavipes]|nr:hypothetical protein TNCV_3929421 [Trichonephila clavipes]